MNESIDKDALNNLADYAENVRMLEAQARAFKEEMEANGWSSTMAEQIAAATFFMPLTNRPSE